MAIRDVFADLRRGLPVPGRPGQVLPGLAVEESFQDPQEVADAEALRMSDDNAEGKIFLGLIGANVARDPEEPRLKDGRTNRYATTGIRIGVGDDRHVMTIAGSRAGKGRAALVPNLITYPGSVLVIDPKGDLAQITAAHRRTMGQDVYVLDPFGVAGDTGETYPGRFNPLAMLARSRGQIADAALIADAIVVSTPGNKDPHWDEAARMFIEGLALHVATCPLYGTREQPRNLVAVYDLLQAAMEPKDGTDPKAGVFRVEQEMKADERTPAARAVKNAARDFYERSDRERDSVLSNARRHLHFLAFPEIQTTLSGSDHSLDLADLKRRPVTIYLSLPAMRMGSCSRWLRLFVNLALNSFEAERVTPRYPVLMCLDEFAVLGPMKTLEDAAGQIAGLGCKLWVVLQDLNQLKSLYAERWETFMGNAGVLQFFGNNDLTTLEWIAKRLGTTGIVNQSQSTVEQQKQQGGGTGEAFANATAELMSAAEIARIFGRDDPQLRQLIIRPTVQPIILQRAFYDKLDFFKNKYTDPAAAAGR